MTRPTYAPKRSSSSRPDGKSPRKPRRPVKRRQKLADREIKHYQATTYLLLRRASFQRFVREIVMDMFPALALRWQETALMALQEAAEAYMIRLFGLTGMAATNAKRKTIMCRDMQLVCHILDDSA